MGIDRLLVCSRGWGDRMGIGRPGRVPRCPCSRRSRDRPPPDCRRTDPAHHRRRLCKQRTADPVDELRRDPGRRGGRRPPVNARRDRRRRPWRRTLGPGAPAGGRRGDHVRILHRGGTLAPVNRVLPRRLPISLEIRHATDRGGGSLGAPGTRDRTPGRRIRRDSRARDLELLNGDRGPAGAVALSSIWRG